MTPPGGAQLLVILLVVLLLFGSRRLPELANAIGRSLRELREGIGSVRDSSEDPPPDGSS